MAEEDRVSDVEPTENQRGGQDGARWEGSREGSHPIAREREKLRRIPCLYRVLSGEASRAAGASGRAVHVAQLNLG